MSNEVLSVEGQLVGIPVETYTGVSGIVVDPVNKTIRADETVLWASGSPSSGGVHDANVTLNLSEAITNFQSAKFYIRTYDGDYGTYSNIVSEVDVSELGTYTSFGFNTLLPNGWWVNWALTFQFANDKKSCYITRIWQIWGDKAYPNSMNDFHTSNTPMYIYKIVGINRKAQ